MVVGSNPIAFTETSDIVSVLSKELLGIQATTECRFTLEGVHDMIITYTDMFMMFAMQTYLKYISMHATKSSILKLKECARCFQCRYNQNAFQNTPSYVSP